MPYILSLVAMFFVYGFLVGGGTIKAGLIGIGSFALAYAFMGVIGLGIGAVALVALLLLNRNGAY